MAAVRPARGVARPCAAALLLSLTLAGFARAQDARALFEEAVRLDASDAGAAPAAFALYRRAAEAGLPEAEFAVGVMLDSGRGVSADVGPAATWYARAAAHGYPRAGYNLGLLYQGGEGVPRNLDLARAWFAASGLPAARERLAALRGRAGHAAPDASSPRPTPVAPAAGAEVRIERGGMELVWTAREPSGPVRFFVEVRALGLTGSREVFSTATDVSSALVPPPNTPGDYAWRVLAVARGGKDYAASVWVRFKAVPDAAVPEAARAGQAPPPL